MPSSPTEFQIIAPLQTKKFKKRTGKLVAFDSQMFLVRTGCLQICITDLKYIVKWIFYWSDVRF